MQRYARVQTFALVKQEKGHSIFAPFWVEVSLHSGMNQWELVGQYPSNLRSALKRIKSAFKNSSFSLPKGRVVINIQSKNLRLQNDNKLENANHFDLPIFLAILLAQGGECNPEEFSSCYCMGNLSLAGKVESFSTLPLFLSYFLNLEAHQKFQREERSVLLIPSLSLSTKYFSKEELRNIYCLEHCNDLEEFIFHFQYYQSSYEEVVKENRELERGIMDTKKRVEGLGCFSDEKKPFLDKKTKCCRNILPKLFSPLLSSSKENRDIKIKDIENKNNKIDVNCYYDYSKYDTPKIERRGVQENHLSSSCAGHDKENKEEQITSAVHILSQLERENIPNYIPDSIRKEREKEFFPVTSIPLFFLKSQKHALRTLLLACSGHHSICFLGSPGTGKSSFMQHVPSLLLHDKRIFQRSYLYEKTKKSEVESGGKSYLFNENRLYVQAPQTLTLALLEKHFSLSKTHYSSDYGELYIEEFLHLDKKSRLVLQEILEPKFNYTGTFNFASPVNSNVQYEETRKPKTENSKEKSSLYSSVPFIIATSNPCPCGLLYESIGKCRCSLGNLARYKERMTEALRERFELFVQVVTPLKEELDLSLQSTGKEQEAFVNKCKEQVFCAQEIQRERNRITSRQSLFNSEVRAEHMAELFRYTKEILAWAKKLSDTSQDSPRRYHQLLRLSRTLADFEQKKDVEKIHILEAYHHHFDAYKE